MLRFSFMSLIIVHLSVCPHPAAAHVQWSAFPHGGCLRTQKEIPHREQPRSIQRRFREACNIEELGTLETVKTSIGLERDAPSQTDAFSGGFGQTLKFNL